MESTDPRGTHRPPWNAQTPVERTDSRGRGPLQDLSLSLWGGHPRGPAFSTWDGGPLVLRPHIWRRRGKGDKRGVSTGLCHPWNPRVTGPVATCSWRPAFFCQSERYGFSIRPENPHEAFTAASSSCDRSGSGKPSRPASPLLPASETSPAAPPGTAPAMKPGTGPGSWRRRGDTSASSLSI